MMVVTSDTGTGSWIPASARLESLARHKNEEDQKSCVDDDCDGQDHQCTRGEQSSNVRLSDAREVEGGVLAQADKGKDGIQRVLI